ncbi:glutathione S-transferase family protein [Aurantivibrio infirmus]
MSDIILHHYPASPFAEKARILLGATKLSWKSVTIPNVMPKPDVVALTGGYRKTPILQIGADIYCDTALIAKKLDQLSDEATLYPRENAFTLESVATWADSILFPISVALVFQPQALAQKFAGVPEKMIQAFVADRAALRKNGVQRKISADEARAVYATYLRKFENQLADGRKYLFGNNLTIADFSVYHPMWFVNGVQVLQEIFKPFPNVLQWLQRMKEIGHGVSSEISSADAISIANAAKTIVSPGGSDLEGIAVGDEVEVTPADYGMDIVAGKLLLSNEEEMVVQRVDERAGAVAVHFPRFCYFAKKAQ